MRRLGLMMFLALVTLSAHAAFSVSPVTLATEMSVALCKKMESCKELGTQTVEECVKIFITGFDPDNPRERIPKVTASELKACTIAVEKGPCGHYAEPPKACRFMKNM